jgi:hypothetical protein
MALLAAAILIQAYLNTGFTHCLGWRFGFA